MVDQARILALVDRQAGVRDRFSRSLAAALLRLWRQLTTSQRYSDAEVAAFARQAGSLTRAARTAVAGSTDAYLRRVLAELEAEPKRVTPKLPDQARGVPWDVEFGRPAKEYRRARLLGLDDLEAAERAERRLTLIGDMDLALAARDTSAQVLAPVEKVQGWRRVVRPELSAGGVCGLCIAASTRIYSRGDLMAIHEHCKCQVLPIVKGKADPGLDLNQESLGNLYRVAGSTAAADLKRVRFTVEQHGELGAVLREQGQAFSGPAKAARRVASSSDVQVDPAAVLKTAEETIAALKKRAAAGEDVSGPMKYQRGLVERMRARVSAEAAPPAAAPAA